MRKPWGKRCAPSEEIRLADPVVVEAQADTDRFKKMRADLFADAPERWAQREVARVMREKAQELVERNHFGESIEIAMRRRP